ncbi:LysR family transcriptional regulator [Leifsonia sp. F6_8S_P_1B]|uniref:LysR family transcriptional regulator n=1 Tax=Leifsonia williamsii TaxID=3035919 RepID=A0ABT8KAU1_9MICO|nr:LysR family transcriptional regulator [Leifsonia williamsii]MDN4614128.1 LysR family transcriptional regulator [Leifsonia williamsii]
MDPMRLRLLRELGDRGSVTAVAAAVGISASAVSQQLAALQAGVPVALTVKQGRRLVLTEAGEALAVAGARVEEALAGARDAVDAFLGERSRTVSVSAFHSAGLALFRPLLAELSGPDGSQPPVVSLRDADVARSEFPGLTADHDLVIAHRLAHEPAWPAGRLHVTPLFVEPLDLALHRAHPLAGRPRITPADLSDERWISVHDGFPLANALDHLAALAGRPLRIEHRINEFFVAAQVVRSGAAVALVPRITAGALADDELVLRPISGVTLARHVDVLARPDAVASAPVRRVLRALRKVAAEAAGA